MARRIRFARDPRSPRHPPLHRPSDGPPPHRFAMGRMKRRHSPIAPARTPPAGALAPAGPVRTWKPRSKPSPSTSAPACGSWGEGAKRPRWRIEGVSEKQRKESNSVRSERSRGPLPSEVEDRRSVKVSASLDRASRLRSMRTEFGNLTTANPPPPSSPRSAAATASSSLRPAPVPVRSASRPACR